MYISSNKVYLNDGFLFCYGNNKRFIRDFNFNIISDILHSEFYDDSKYAQIEYVHIYPWKYLSIYFNNGRLIHNYIPYSIQNFYDYPLLYKQDQVLFYRYEDGQNLYKIPFNIYIMLKHTTLLSNNVLTNCLFMLDILLYDVATIILPLTLELVRLDFKLYTHKN